MGKVNSFFNLALFLGVISKKVYIYKMITTVFGLDTFVFIIAATPTTVKIKITYKSV